MPTYEYQCTKCGHSFEVIRKITEAPLTDCEKCGGKVRKVMFPVGIVFKGSGFHINDYRKPDKSSAGEDSESSTKDAASKN
ncbi:MAG: zinc ribbon domain-containing protein [Armatimonadota bacterium]|nr:zinc ribbon domain-containing protein [Armatimonadota bacterium]